VLDRGLSSGNGGLPVESERNCFADKEISNLRISQIKTNTKAPRKKAFRRSSESEKPCAALGGARLTLAA
jgi:hypothetical protein